MADYSTNATELSAPKGAGASVTAPVQQMQSNIPHALGVVSNLFAQSLADKQKAQAEERKQAAIKSYVTAETSINDGLASGSLDAAKAASLSRANFNKHAAGYTEYITEFKSAGDALRGFTEKGEAEAEVKRAIELRSADMAQASKMGFIYLPGMGKKAEDEQTLASKTIIRANEEFEAMRKRNIENREAGQYQSQLDQREQKEQSIRLINQVASSNLDAFSSFATSLGEQVKNNQTTPDIARITLADRFSKINGTLQSLAGVNIELAAPYRTLFNELNTISQKLIDPKQQSEDLDTRIKVIKDKLKLMALGDPKIAASVISSELFTNNPALQMHVAKEAIRAISILSNIPSTDKSTFVPQVVGDPEVEPAVLETLKGAINNIRSGKVNDKELATIQASNSVNHILTQTSELLNRGIPADKLSGLAKFFASSEYVSLVSSGKIDINAASAAYKTFQMMYEPMIIKGVQQKFEQFIYGQASFGQKQEEPIPLSKTIDVVFSGSGIVFKTKDNQKLDPVEAISREKSLKELSSTQVAINQLIRIAAHLEGKTDYSKYWEDNKHIWMPQLFDKPEEKTKTSSSSGEKGMKEAATLSPKEQRFDELFNLTDANLEELKQEIAKQKNPVALQILQNEYEKILAARKAFSQGVK